MHKLSIRSVSRAIQLQLLKSLPCHLKLIESVHDSNADDILNAIVTCESVGADVEGDIVGFADRLGDSVISHTPQLIGHLFATRAPNCIVLQKLSLLLSFFSQVHFLSPWLMVENS